MSKQAVIISNVIYAIGTIIACLLLCAAIFGKNIILNNDPSAMINLTLQDQASKWLAAGAIPMLIACALVCALNSVKGAPNAFGKHLLIFLPGLICAGFMLFGVITFMIRFINTLSNFMAD